MAILKKKFFVIQTEIIDIVQDFHARIRTKDEDPIVKDQDHDENLIQPGLTFGP